jgi:hypothetical protein
MRQSNNHFLILPIISALVSSAPATAGQDDNPDTPCLRTARSMLHACIAETGDDLNTAIGICINLGGTEERRTCRADAWLARREVLGECRDVLEAREDACELLDEDRYSPDPLLNPANSFINPADIPDIHAPNPYVSLVSGRTYLLRAGDDGEEIVVVHVTDQSREILGALCRVAVDIVVEVSEENGTVDYAAVEVTDDWFAQDTQGNVYYCGEVSRNYEDGVLRDLAGSFEAGRESAKAGLLLRALPNPSDAHRQEFALGEAEDIVQYLDTAAIPPAVEGGDNDAFPCAPDGCLKTLEFNPLEPEASEFKYYLPGTGFVLAVPMEDSEITGEREELVCMGDSVEILDDPACGIEDPEALVEALCALAPETFCAE